MALQAVEECFVAGSPEGTSQRSPQRKLRETVSTMTRKPRQGRHIGFIYTKSAHNQLAMRRMNLRACDFVERFSEEGT
jgi:hypothetical protein